MSPLRQSRTARNARSGGPSENPSPSRTMASMCSACRQAAADGNVPTRDTWYGSGARISTNIAANVVAPANGFANMAPAKIDFKLGGYITGVIGILIFPWKLIADPQGYIFRWLIAYSALLGSLAGIMICDYYLVRKTKINVAGLFDPAGEYKGWNAPAWIAFTISILPVIPGFLVAVGTGKAELFPVFFVNLYSYAWFVTFFLSFIIYFLIAKIKTE